jgi:multidrug efflux pump subunit AcrA (membrane-fusion protein)
MSLETSVPGAAATTRKRRWFVLLTAAVVMAAITVTGAAMMGRPQPTSIKNNIPDDPDATAEDNRPSVKTIRPRRDPSILVQVKQFASVEPFYQADLHARASGVVRAVHKDIKDRVVKDEVLIEIDVPDLALEVDQKKAAVKQRRQELRVAQARLSEAEIGREVAETVIRQRQAEMRMAEATRDFRRLRLGRIRTLHKQGTRNGSVTPRRARRPSMRQQWPSIGRGPTSRKRHPKSSPPRPTST